MYVQATAPAFGRAGGRPRTAPGQPSFRFRTAIEPFRAGHLKVR